MTEPRHPSMPSGQGNPMQPHPTHAVPPGPPPRPQQGPHAVPPQAPHQPQVPHAPHAAHAPHAPVGAPPLRAQPGIPGQQITPGLQMARMVPPPPKAVQADNDTIALVEVEDEEAPLEEAPVVSKIKAFGSDLRHRQHQWKRQPHVTGQGATRMKSFHGKYSDQGLEYLDDAINEWLDSHPEVEVKFVTSTVAVFEGKVREPALVLNLWY